MEELIIVKRLCEILGTEPGLEWVGNDGKTYYIGHKGELVEITYKSECGRWEGSESRDIGKVLIGELKPAWKPKHGTTYYIPDIFVKGLCLAERWENLDIDYIYLKRGLVFETEEEAVAMAKKIIKFIKEERENEGN